MKKIIVACVFILAITINSYAQNKTAAFNEDMLLEHVKILSSDAFEGRKTGEKGNELARAYIIKQFESLGAFSCNENYEQPFTFKYRGTSYKGVNVLAEIKGTETPEKYIVISAHYDHLGIRKGVIYNGADDDASGVAALFSYAEYFAKNPPKHSVMFAAFDAEELGLQGAKHFVKTTDKTIMVNVNMDMISRSPKNELYVVGGRFNTTLKTIIDKLNNTTDTKLLVGHDGTDGKMNWTMSSDHAPFHLAKIPFLYFGNEDHSAYHKPSDDFKDITPQFYKNSFKIILSVIKSIDTFGI